MSTPGFRAFFTGGLLLVGVLLVDAVSMAQEIGPGPMPHPVIQRDLTLTSMRVDVTLRGAVAHTVIRQTLRNDGGVMAEGNYMLPLPPGATVSDFAIVDGDKRLTPEVLSAEEARRIYEEIVRKMRDPGLLEYQDHNTFSVSVFPFQPGESRSVEVSFTQTLSGTTDLVTYQLPLKWAGWCRCDNTSFVLTYDIDTDYELGTVSSPTHGVSVRRDGDHRASGSYEATVNDFASDFMLNVGRRLGDFAASVMCFPGDGGEDGYFLLSLLAALPKDDAYVPKDILFIFDKSGSMSGEKIEQARGALRFVLGQLKAQDRFNVIYYSDYVDLLFDGLRDANSENTREARSFVDSLSADGSTDINSALIEGSRIIQPDGRPAYVIFLTDGLPTAGDTDVDHIIGNAKENFAKAVKLFVFGVGYDVNTTLLDSLSYNHHGSATYVSPEEDIEAKVSQFYAKVSSPALIDLSIELNGLDEYDVMPKDLPDLFHNSEIFVSGRYRGRPSNEIRVTVAGSTDKGRREMTAAVGASVSSANYQVPRLWATRKVSYLLDQIRLHGDDRELIDEVDRLATRYGIVTPYTSYLITEPELYFDAAGRQAVFEEEMSFAREEAVGGTAVARSKLNQANQAADVAAAPQAAGAAAGEQDAEVWLDRAFVKYGDAEENRRGGSADPYSTVNYVNNQTFVRQDAQWIDARYDRDHQQVIQVTTYGDAYFQLLEEYPALGDYLSQGEEVVVVVDDNLVLETTLSEVTNTAAELDQLRSALSQGSYLTYAPGERGDLALGAGIGLVAGGAVLLGLRVASRARCDSSGSRG